MTTVKTSRRTQAQRSQATRAKILRTARTRFVKDGYNATTMARIAAEAGVAVQTVYFVFHTKGELLNAVLEAAVLGDDNVPPQRTDWHRTATTTNDGQAAIEAFVGGCAQILRRSAPLEYVVRTAMHTEPTVRRSREYGEGLRVDGFRDFVDSLNSRRLLRPGEDPALCADVLLTMLGPSTYLAFTTERGWTHDEYVAWATRALTRLLLW